jgi:flagellar protein FlaG
MVMMYPTQGVQGVGAVSPAKTVAQPVTPVVAPVVAVSLKAKSPVPSPTPPVIDAPELDQILKEVRADLAEGAANLDISVDQDTGKTIVRVIDEHTQEVIRQIPSEELIAISRSLTKLEGKFLDTKV